jgi:hypothetical protein
MKALAATCLVLAVSAGATSIQDIRDMYYQAGADIEAEVLYSTVVNINSGEMSFPAVGVFGRTVTFYWTADPWNTPANVLVKAVVSSRVSAVEESAEYLYDYWGGLLFCYIEGGIDQVEHRFYFSEGRLIRFMEGDDINDSPDQSLGTDALDRGEQLHQAFVLLH